MSEEMELTPYNVNGTPMGLEGYTPRQSLGQLKRDSIAGEIEYTPTGERRESWTVIFTGGRWERSLFTGGFGEGVKPDCKGHSNDLNRDAVVGEVYGDCFKCQYSQWTKDEDGKNKPPKCKETLALTGFLDAGMTLPFVLRLSGKSLNTGTQILDYLYYHKSDTFKKFYKVSLGDLQQKGSTAWRDWIITEGEDVAEDLRASIATDHDKRLKAGPVIVEEEDIATGVSADEVADLMGGEVVEEGEVVEDKPMPADFATKKPTQEEQVKNGTIPFAS